MRLRQRRRQRHARKEGRAGDRRRDAVRAREKKKKGIFFLSFCPLVSASTFDSTAPTARHRAGVFFAGHPRGRYPKANGGCACVWTEARVPRAMFWDGRARRGRGGLAVRVRLAIFLGVIPSPLRHRSSSLVGPSPVGVREVAGGHRAVWLLGSAVRLGDNGFGRRVFPARCACGVKQ